MARQRKRKYHLAGTTNVLYHISGKAPLSVSLGDSLQLLKEGVLRARPMVQPPRRPAIGTVMNQDRMTRKTRCQLTALNLPLQRPTPIVAPVMHIVVDTGRLYCEKIMTVMAAPISIEEPRLGE